MQFMLSGLSSTARESETQSLRLSQSTADVSHKRQRNLTDKSATFDQNAQFEPSIRTAPKFQSEAEVIKSPIRRIKFRKETIPRE